MYRNKFIIIFGFTLLLLLAAHLPDQPEQVNISYPNGWPKPVYDFNKHPITKQGIELGRQLFYDPILSKDSTITCANCHLSYTAFTHVDHALSHGIGDSTGIRNSPTLINLAWNKLFMWDGAVNHLEVQPLSPISHPDEMGEDFATVIHKLQRTQRYPQLFMGVYGDTAITGARMLKALAQFQLTFISANSKYDKVMRGEDKYTEQEQKGYEIFKANCTSCHLEPLFTTGEFANNGLAVDTDLMDFGRMKVTQLSKDSLKFKIPTLRNIEYSYPYMHDGRFKTLFEVVNHYTSGIEKSETLAPELKEGIDLTSEEKVDLISFLLTLSDRDFLFNADFAFPKK